MAWRNCACAYLSFLVLHVLTWNYLHSFLFVQATISQAWVCSFRTKICGNCNSTLSSLRSKRRYHRAKTVSNFSVCLSSVCVSSVICLSVGLSVIKLLPAYGTDHYQKFIFGFFRPLRGSVWIWYWPQSNPPPPYAPQKWPPKWKCLVFNVLTWNFVHNLLTLAAS